MEHINITFPLELKERLDKEAKQEKIKRSTLIQKAVRELHLLCGCRMKELDMPRRSWLLPILKQ